MDQISPTCTAADDWDVWGQRDPGPLTACGEPTMAVLTQACVHEHVDRVFLCATCAAELQRTADLLICRHCEQAGHECPVTIKIEWLEAARD